MQVDMLISTIATSVFQCCRVCLNPSDTWMTRCHIICPPWVRVILQIIEQRTECCSDDARCDETCVRTRLAGLPSCCFTRVSLLMYTNAYSSLFWMVQWHKTRNDKRSCFVDSFFSCGTSGGEGRSRVSMKYICIHISPRHRPRPLPENTCTLRQKYVTKGR